MLMKLTGKFLAKGFVPTIFYLAKKFGEVNPWSQFHQHFTNSCFDNVLLPRNFKAKLKLE